VIYETLKSQILNGSYPTGARIPPETELTKRFGASRMTVNRAIKELQMAGYVRRTRGSGTYVLSRQVTNIRQLLPSKVIVRKSLGIHNPAIRTHRT
jgi:DNA-binding GntR family transcriptional regulator